MARSKREQTSADGIVRIKKYANRRLYNTETSAYVTLDDLAEMVRIDREFEVVDAKSGDDLTHSVLTQIILDQEGKGQNLLPVNFLRQLIRFYGDSVGQFVPKYLEISMNTLTRDQDRYREQMDQAMAGTPLDVFQRQAQQNMELFEKTMLSMWVPPFAGTTSDKLMTEPGSEGEQPTSNGAVNGTAKTDKAAGTVGAVAKAKATAPEPESDDDLVELKAQIASIQAKLDRLAK